MNEEEVKETLKTMKENIDKKYLKTRNSVAIETVLNLIKTQQVELEKKNKIIDEALEIAFEYGQIDGEHHKTWVIDQIVKCLTGSDYNEWVAHYEHDEETQGEYTWHKGIAP